MTRCWPIRRAAAVAAVRHVRRARRGRRAAWAIVCVTLGSGGIIATPHLLSPHSPGAAGRGETLGIGQPSARGPVLVGSSQAGRDGHPIPEPGSAVLLAAAVAAMAWRMSRC